MDKCKHQIPWDEHCTVCYAKYTANIHLAAATGGSSPYYDLPLNCKTLQDVIEGKNMNWSQANIFKAAYRWDIKPALKYNLEKILWFGKDKLKRLDEEAEEPNNGTTG